MSQNLSVRSFGQARRFWLFWGLANTAAFVLVELGYLAAAAVAGWQNAAYGLFIALLLSVGPLQALVLRLRLPGISVWQWSVATAAGQALSGTMVLWLFFSFVDPEYVRMDRYAPLSGLVIGVGVGLFQYLVLRRYMHAGLTWLWIPADMAAWAISGAVVQSNIPVSLAGPQFAYLAEVMKALIVGAVLAISTAAAMRMILSGNRRFR